MPCPADLLLPLPGYIYSLCPAAEALTEKCFQMMTLPFVGDTHTIRYLDNHTGQEQNKTKQNKTKQNKTKQNKTKQNKTTCPLFLPTYLPIMFPK
jgi:hypothetical protein